MRQELRSAAQRILDDECDGRDGLEDDAVRVAQAWIAGDFSDDDEPISGDFLRSVGFLPDDAGAELAITLHDWSDREDGLHLLIHPESGQATLEEYDEHGEHVAAVLLPACQTCGDVRRLCAALGIPLPETE